MLKRIADGRTDLVFELPPSALPALGDDGLPLMRWCAYYGDVSAVRHLLARGESLELLGENFDLNGAAFHGHWRLCQFLIECGADANRPLLETGETPLHAALSKANRPSHEQVVAVLLAGGADPNAATTPNAETGAFMRDASTRGETPLHRAAAFAGEATIALLIEAGAQRERRDAHGDTPLGWASWHLRPAAILRLLCYGDYSLRPDASWTGDHGAGWSGMDLNLVGKPHLTNRTEPGREPANNL
jgi:ankyrin repeat protein